MGPLGKIWLTFQLPPRSIGPAGMSGRITAIAVAPADRDTWYVGSASGGLWKTVNAGTTFVPVFDEQPVQSIGAVAIAPSNSDVIYAGTGEGNPRNSQSSGAGVFRSNDGGDSWELVGLEASRNVHRILVHPRDENVLWVGVLGDPFADSEQALRRPVGIPAHAVGLHLGRRGFGAVREPRRR